MFGQKYLSRVLRLGGILLLVGVLLFTSLPLGLAAPSSEVVPKPVATSTVQPTAPYYLRTDGSRLVDAQGKDVRLTGINWFGFETGTYAPHGLETRNWQDMLDQMSRMGFNVIRLPYSNEMFDKNAVPSGINYQLNPDLKGLTPLQIMDKIIKGTGQRGIKVILDQHRPNSQAQSDLWYTNQLSQKRWIDDWVGLAQRYNGNDTVIGADLHNEPHGPATWGTDNPSTDWNVAAEKAGNAILQVNPHWLIIVEGVEQYHNNYYWWGGNLEGVQNHPVHLIRPDKLVYSAHDYGPSVSQQNWFNAPTFPANLPALWHKYWHYVVQSNEAPVFVGEFGGPSMGKDTEGVWQRTLLKYMGENHISWTYWALNPDSGDTGGILKPDWKTVDAAKYAALKPYLALKLPVHDPTVLHPTAVPKGLSNP